MNEVDRLSNLLIFIHTLHAIAATQGNNKKIKFVGSF